ncbi:MAG TPA: hypothetical protein VF834_21020 [Streptosporangiaceae bacterium]
MTLARFARRASAAVAVAAAVTMVAGCGSPGKSAAYKPSAPRSSAGAPTAGATSSQAVTPASGSTTPTSCNVITVAEASAALGQPVKPPIKGNAYVEGGVACVFYGPDVPPGISPNVPVGDTVRVVLVTGPNARKWFDDYRSRVPAKAISGLGDAAYYDGYASISVLKGDAYVRIAVGIANNLSAEEVLARDALPRM